MNYERNKDCEIALILICVSNICFYTMEYILLYIVLTMVALGILALKAIPNLKSGRLYIPIGIVWLAINYGIFTFNGLLRLKSGTYNWDMMLYTCVQNCALYFGFSKILTTENWFKSLKNVIFSTTIISLLVLIGGEIQNFGVNGLRIGDSLSGNVNVAGANFGILSLFIVFFCNREKKLGNWFVFGIVSAVMLLTGSKMTIIVLMIDLIYFIATSKNKINTIFLVLIAMLLLLFIVFRVPYFYNVIGYRIIDMIYQLFGVGPGHYSNSTNVRKIMIKEGLVFFTNHPLLGGGEKYFGSLTSTIYSYSHCNYTEILSNFGLVGFWVYYMPIFINIVFMVHNKQRDNGLLALSASLLGVRLLLDWMQVTYSEPCIGYIPMLFSFIYIRLLYKEDKANIVKGENGYVKNSNYKVFMEE